MTKSITGTRQFKRRLDGKPIATCDRCGMTYHYTQLKREWTGLFVCEGADTVNCWEPMHPRLMFVAPTDNSLVMPYPRPSRDANGLIYADGQMAEKEPLSYQASLAAIRARGAL